MKPQDILILLKLLSVESTEWRYATFAQSLHMSTSTIFAALKRAELSGLYHKNTRTVHREALLEFLLFGLKYVFPVGLGKVAKGIPTAHSANPLAQFIVSESDIYVWKSANGTVRGHTIEPLYITIPQLAKEDSQLYEILTLIDALRVGKAREKQLATTLLTQKIMQKNE
jgi:hypothetical protein